MCCWEFSCKVCTGIKRILRHGLLSTHSGRVPGLCVLRQFLPERLLNPCIFFWESNNYFEFCTLRRRSWFSEPPWWHDVCPQCKWVPICLSSLDHTHCFFGRSDLRGLSCKPELDHLVQDVARARPPQTTMRPKLHHTDWASGRPRPH